MTRAVAMWVLLALGGGCLPDDWDGTYPDDDPDVTDTDGAGDTDAVSDGALVGAWRSEGQDLSGLFADAGVRWVEASFGADGRYQVLVEDASGERGNFAGSWSVGSGSPASITMEQDEPYPATAEGLYEVDGNVLTFETVQVFPDYGNSPPSDRFGTSQGPGISPGSNVQTYRRQGS